MKILHISDTHGHHRKLKLQEADILVYTGDESNQRSQFLNHTEFIDFFNWLSEVRGNFKRVLFVPGNHSTWIYHNEKEARRLFKSIDVDFLNKDEVVIDGIKFYGDPIMPRFGDWCYMTDRAKTVRHWDLIPTDVDVLLTHTPPKGVLDLSEDRYHSIEMCGDSALYKKILKLPNLKLHCFGHIHHNHGIRNNGILNLDGVLFSNATAVIEGKFDLGIVYHGNIIELC